MSVNTASVGLTAGMVGLVESGRKIAEAEAVLAKATETYKLLQRQVFADLTDEESPADIYKLPDVGWVTVEADHDRCVVYVKPLAARDLTAG